MGLNFTKATLHSPNSDDNPAPSSFRQVETDDGQRKKRQSSEKDSSNLRANRPRGMSPKRRKLEKETSVSDPNESSRYLFLAIWPSFRLPNKGDNSNELQIFENFPEKFC